MQIVACSRLLNYSWSDNEKQNKYSNNNFFNNWQIGIFFSIFSLYGLGTAHILIVLFYNFFYKNIVGSPKDMKRVA